MKYAFIEAHRPLWRLRLMCRVLGVSKSGYFAWRQRAPSPRSQADRTLTAQITAVHQKHRGVYGSPRVHQALRYQGVCVGRHRVERLMRNAGIRDRQEADECHEQDASCATQHEKASNWFDDHEAVVHEHQTKRLGPVRVELILVQPHRWIQPHLSVPRRED